MKRLRTALVLAALAGLFYAGVCLLMVLQQRNLVYFPQATRSGAATTDFAVERGGTVLRGWVVNPGAGDPVLYFGGNAERVEDNRADFAAWFPQRSVYLLAYRGYGASDGTPSEADLHADALAFHDAVRARHPGQRLALLGRSLGSGVAAYVAARRPVERVALVTPFDSLVEVAASHYPWLPVRLLLRERYDVAGQLRDYAGPLLVVRAGRDEVVPACNTERLIAGWNRGQAEVVVIEHAGHHDLHLAPGYREALSRFLR